MDKDFIRYVPMQIEPYVYVCPKCNLYLHIEPNTDQHIVHLQNHIAKLQVEICSLRNELPREELKCKSNPKQWHIVMNDNFQEFEKELDRFLKDGWELQGGICVTVEPFNNYHGHGIKNCFYQMMIMDN